MGRSDLKWNEYLAVIDGIIDTKKSVDILRDHLFEGVSNLGIRDDFWLPTRQRLHTYDANIKRVFIIQGSLNASNVLQSPVCNSIENLCHC